MSEASGRRAVSRVLVSSVRGRRRDLIALAGWSLIQALPALLSGRLVAQAMDDGFLADSASTGFVWLGVLGVSALAGAWGTRQAYRRLAGLVEPFRDQLVVGSIGAALRRSTARGAKADTAGVARLTQQVEIAREAYGAALMSVQAFLVISISAMIGLLTLAPAVILLVLPPVVVGLALFLGALGRIAARQRDSILAEEGIAEDAGTVSAGLRDIVACGAEDRVRATADRQITAQAQATRDLARLTAVRTLAVAVGGWLPLLLLLAGAPWLLRNGASTGEILGAVTYVLQGVHPALQTLVRGLGGPGLWLVVALRRLLEAATEGTPPAVARESVGRPEAPIGHELRLSGVTFGYGRQAEPVIDELDLTVPAGDHLAVVGPSGVGKSTLAGLMAGMLEPDAGEVLIGVVRAGELDARAAARQRVLIPQEAYVFAGTLWENVAYLNPRAGVVAVDRAVDLLGARGLVERLGGYGAEVRADELSAGERQLVTLVRAYVSPAPLVLFDEATCHLDPVAEARVEQAFARRPGTLVVIAHRISSALRAHRILVLDGSGAVVGTHEELLAQSALYRDLVGNWRAEAVVAA